MGVTYAQPYRSILSFQERNGEKDRVYSIDIGCSAGKLYQTVFIGEMYRTRIFKKLQKTVALSGYLCYINQAKKSGCSAVGSVLEWGSRGRAFKSPHSDLKKLQDLMI